MSATLLAALGQRTADTALSPILTPPILTRQLTLSSSPLIGRVLGNVDLMLLILAQLPRYTTSRRMAAMPPSWLGVVCACRLLRDYVQRAREVGVLPGDVALLDSRGAVERRLAELDQRRKELQQLEQRGEDEAAEWTAFTAKPGFHLPKAPQGAHDLVYRNRAGKGWYRRVERLQ